MFSEKTMEEDEGLRSTVECLRGRLLAERASSKAANDESDQIALKVTELEKQLKKEIKSRNKAEKRLKSLMKKLDSLNISYVSADESCSSFSEKSEISSVSSSTNQNQMELKKLGSVDEVISVDSNENVSQNDENNGSKSSVTNNDIDNEGHDEDTNHSVDNSMALVLVEEKMVATPRNDDKCDDSMALVVFDSIVKEKKQVPITNGNVKDVLDALRYARESLQASMQMRKHMNSNIAQPRLNGISC
ncbi:hypothetical protein CTI12_AA324330 [Artemisia annua]|uniref:Uncharacterized protein n=1 Tax=Artemisia annua TaxID=35608 RepID=A0A2U1MQV7_ARTAN|nr:hypothetical protein CTI12_AA324330 [Artemisia annua]